MPRLARPSGEVRQRFGMRRGFLGELERDVPRVVEAGLLVEVHVALDLLPLLPQQQRQQVTGPQLAPEPPPPPRVEGGARPLRRRPGARLREPPRPQLPVDLLHSPRPDVYLPS